MTGMQDQFDTALQGYCNGVYIPISTSHVCFFGQIQNQRNFFTLKYHLVTFERHAHAIYFIARLLYTLLSASKRIIFEGTRWGLLQYPYD